MDLREALLKEHSKKQTTIITNYIGNDKTRFDQLMKLFYANEYRITQRASWVMSNCVTNHPDLILPHLKMVINNLDALNLHDAVKRNTYRVLEFIPVPEKLTGKLTNSCFDALTNKNEAVAIKVFAMRVLLKIVKQNPELKREFQLIIEAQMPYLSAAFKSRGTKVLHELKKIGL